MYYFFPGHRVFWRHCAVASLCGGSMVVRMFESTALAQNTNRTLSIEQTFYE
jgi:hypothetical protein